MNRPGRERRWQSPKDRAQVAAELIEEAESLSESGLIATPADLMQATRPAPIRVEREARGIATPAPATTPLPVSLPETPTASPAEPVVSVTTVGPHPSHPARDPEKALAELDRALGATPDDTACLLARAGLLGSLGNYAAARRDLERLLTVSPDHGEALTALGIVLSRRGLWGEAATMLRKAVSLDAARSAAWYYLGEALNRLDDLAGRPLWAPRVRLRFRAGEAELAALLERVAPGDGTALKEE